MNDRDIHDFRLWYSSTFVRIGGVIVYVDGSSSPDENVAHEPLEVRGITLDGGGVWFRIYNLSEVEPVKLVSKIVDTGTRLGQVYLTRNPRRQYKKSICDSTISTVPSTTVSAKLISNYVHSPLVTYSPQEAKERVLSGTALWSAVSDKMLIGASRGSPSFSCMWRGRMIGRFAINKGEPDVKTLVISKPNGFLLESISASIPGVKCRVAR